jgi:predicted  nucleic acid-binding Zn-ribbon protein
VQIGSKITENKRLVKQQESQKKDHAELQEEAERHQGNAYRLTQEVEAARDAVRQHQGELQRAQGEKQALETELEKVKRELRDSADRNPLLHQQIQVNT